MDQITVHNQSFKPFLREELIIKRVQELASEIDKDYKDQNPLFLSILNGSFIFSADLFRHLTIPAEISFIKLASYKGTRSTGKIVTAIGMDESITGRHVIIVEDIIDTGKTLHSFLPELYSRQPLSIKIATFLSKPAALKYDVKTDYVGFEIPNKFVVGYGLDYDGLGRNYRDLYELIEDIPG
jgi:hypoxanthine phosphoribosyltransferase